MSEVIPPRVDDALVDALATAFQWGNLGGEARERATDAAEADLRAAIHEALAGAREEFAADALLQWSDECARADAAESRLSRVEAAAEVLLREAEGSVPGFALRKACRQMRAALAAPETRDAEDDPTCRETTADLRRERDGLRRDIRDIATGRLHVDRKETPAARCRCGAILIPNGWARWDGHSASWTDPSLPTCPAAPAPRHFTPAKETDR